MGLFSCLKSHRSSECLVPVQTKRAIQNSVYNIERNSKIEFPILHQLEKSKGFTQIPDAKGVQKDCATQTYFSDASLQGNVDYTIQCLSVETETSRTFHKASIFDKRPSIHGPFKKSISPFCALNISKCLRKKGRTQVEGNGCYRPNIKMHQFVKCFQWKIAEKLVRNRIVMEKTKTCQMKEEVLNFLNSYPTIAAGEVMTDTTRNFNYSLYKSQQKSSAIMETDKADCLISSYEHNFEICVLKQASKHSFYSDHSKRNFAVPVNKENFEFNAYKPLDLNIKQLAQIRALKFFLMSYHTIHDKSLHIYHMVYNNLNCKDSSFSSMSANKKSGGNEIPDVFSPILPIEGEIPHEETTQNPLQDHPSVLCSTMATQTLYSSDAIIFNAFRYSVTSHSGAMILTDYCEGMGACNTRSIRYWYPILIKEVQIHDHETYLSALEIS